MLDRRTRVLTEEDIEKIASTYHSWRNLEGDYEDVAGFCKSASIGKVAGLDYVLTPGRYVGLPDEEDDFDFEIRLKELRQTLAKQMEEEIQINALIQENLSKLEKANE
jgi:type I restriction enzyme M protein